MKTASVWRVREHDAALASNYYQEASLEDPQNRVLVTVENRGTETLRNLQVNVTVPDVLETSGGNPGGYLHNSLVDSFAPIPTTEKLPIGAQIVGRRWRDVDLLATASLLASVANLPTSRR